MFFYELAKPGLFFCLFSSFQTLITNFRTNRYVKKCYVHLVHGAGIQTLEHESPPINTRPGLTPHMSKFQWLGFAKLNSEFAESLHVVS